MFDIGFFELLVIGVVLLLVMGPEKLPEVAKQAAFFVRKARQGMFKLRTEMGQEMQGTPFEDFNKAKQEIADLKRDIKQMGSDLANAAEAKIDVKTRVEDSHIDSTPIDQPKPEAQLDTSTQSDPVATKRSDH